MRWRKRSTSSTTASPDGQVPAEILEWLGIEFYNAKEYAPAAKYLAALSKTGNVSSVKPDFWFYLGDAQMKLNQPAGGGSVAAKISAKRRAIRRQKRKRCSPWARRRSAPTNPMTRKKSRMKS